MFSKSLDFSKFYYQVVEWNALARNGQHVVDKTTIDFQISLVEEETREMIDAIKNSDKVEYLDAICDMFVVGAYWHYLVEQYQDPYEGFLAPYLAEMPEEDQDYAEIVVDTLESRNSYNFLMAVESVLYMFNGNSEKALQEVLDSNMSKFPLERELRYAGSLYLNDEQFENKLLSECKTIETNSDGRYTGVTYTKVKDSDNNTRYIFWSDKGKICKPSTFFSPKLDKFC